MIKTAVVSNFCLTIVVVFVLLALFYASLFMIDSLVIFNGQNQPITIKSVQINGSEVDSDRQPIPVTLSHSSNRSAYHGAGLWLNYRTISPEVNLVVELIDISTGMVSKRSCTYRRTDRIRCFVEVSVSNDSLTCGTCDSVF